MFVQVFQGNVNDADELFQAIETWVERIGPTADAWLGSTVGVTDDGLAVCTARFTSYEEAQRNSQRPEQHQWWMETSKLFAGDVTFSDSRNVVEFLEGGSDD